MRDGPATLGPDDLGKLVESVAGMESEVVNVSYGGEEDELHELIPVYCGNDFKDKAVETGERRSSRVVYRD